MTSYVGGNGATSLPRTARDTLVAAASACVAVGTMLSGLAVLLTLIEVTRIGLAPASYNVGQGFDIAHDVVLSGAFVIVTGALLGIVDIRERTLAIAAAVAGGAFIALVVAEVLYATSEPPHAGALVTSDLLSALQAGFLVAAALISTLAFRRAQTGPASDQAQRDGLLASAALGVAIGFALATAASIVFISAIRAPGGEAGRWVTAIGSATASGGAIMATIAFAVSYRAQRGGALQWWPRREGLIAAAFAFFVVAFLLAGLGNAITADHSSQNLDPGLLIAARWVEAASGFVIGAGATLATTGFLKSRRL